MQPFTPTVNVIAKSEFGEFLELFDVCRKVQVEIGSLHLSFFLILLVFFFFLIDDNVESIKSKILTAMEMPDCEKFAMDLVIQMRKNRIVAPMEEFGSGLFSELKRELSGSGCSNRLLAVVIAPLPHVTLGSNTITILKKKGVFPWAWTHNSSSEVVDLARDDEDPLLTQASVCLSFSFVSFCFLLFFLSTHSPLSAILLCASR